jgi:hypothetical protein
MLGGQLGQYGGQLGQYGGQLGAYGRGQLGGVGGYTRISGVAVKESLRPIIPAYPEIAGRLDRLLANATNATGGRDIEVDLEKNTLVLRGTVRNSYEKQLAESFALLEPGVQQVRNELQVPPPSRRTTRAARSGPGP